MRPPPQFVYGAAVLVSSSLVFWIQPLAARGLLPVMGGAPVVWNTAMLFFQGTLLAGYLLAHLWELSLPRWVQLAALGCLWSAVLLAAWSRGFGPLLGEAPPQTGVVLPALWVLGSLAVTYGPACLAVSLLSPLISTWLWRARDTVDPYVLYAVSNRGSIGVLLLYPFVLEPLFGVGLQLRLWHLAFGLLFVLLALLGVSRRGNPVESLSQPPAAPPGAMPFGAACRVVLLALLPGALLHGVTLSLSTDVASSPFLWVAPLALYLGTYALAFGQRQVFARWRRGLSAGALPGGLILFAVLGGFTDMGLWWGVFHLALFALVALWCHGLLWELRPGGGDPVSGTGQALTRFYVLIAAGGLLGGLLSVLVFPLVFPEVWEYPLLFALAALCLPKRAPAGAAAPAAWAWSRGLSSAGVAVVSTLCLHVDSYPVWLRLAAVAALVLSLPGLWSLRVRPAGLAAALLLVSFAPLLAWPLRGGEVLARQRTWFGVYRVVEMAGEEAPGRLRLFFHGTTLHGMAWRGEDGRVENRTGYYAPEGSHGEVMRALRRRQGGSPGSNAGQALRLGFVGLGTGSLLCYAAPGDAVSVWEIDPAVVSLAKTHFTALGDCAPEAVIHVGDGRLSLRKEAPGSFDALFLDAFSSGSIPVHLLTLEALADYLRVLEPGGVLAVHISNRHLNLEPLLELAKAELDLAGLVTRFEPPHGPVPRTLPQTTHLAVLARQASVLEGLELGAGWRPLETRQPSWWRRAWTDDSASLVPYLR